MGYAIVGESIWAAIAGKSDRMGICYRDRKKKETPRNRVSFADIPNGSIKTVWAMPSWVNPYGLPSRVKVIVWAIRHRDR